jgi:hypothetical protein
MSIFSWDTLFVVPTFFHLVSIGLEMNVAILGELCFPRTFRSLVVDDFKNILILMSLNRLDNGVC